MKKIRFILTCISLFSCATSFAGVYKWIDEAGRVHYSNTPHKAAKEIKLPPSTTYSAGNKKKTTEKNPSRKNKITVVETIQEYDIVEIIKPKENAVIRSNEGKVQVTIKLVPTLGEGHTRQIVLDNTVPPDIILPSNGATLSTIERGKHQFVLEIKDKEGKVVGKSKPRHFTLRRVAVEDETED